MIITNKIINNIPIREFFLNNNDKKNLIFFFHGFQSNNESLMGRGEKLAEMGFHVVAIDAYLHGKRSKETFNNLNKSDKYKLFLDIVIRSAEDANYLWENYYSKNENIFNDYFYSYGVSMGAAITFYLSTITNKLKYAVTLVGSPSFVSYYEDRAKLFNWDQSFVLEKINEYKNKCPLINYERTKNTNFILCLGKNDDVVNPKYSIEFNKISKENTILKIYDTAHLSTEEMLNDAYSFLKDNMRKR